MKVSNCCGASPAPILGRQGDIDNDTETFGLCPECGEHCEYEEESEADEQIQLYLDIKKAFYKLKADELKRRGLTWTKFNEIEKIVKDNWSKLIADKGYIELGEGLIAVGVEKEIRLYQGKGQVIDKELKISIHQKR